MDTIPYLFYKNLTKDITFDNYPLIVNGYYKLLRLYATENITTEEVIDKIVIFQFRFGKFHKFGWWDLE